jgi:glutathione S-transferase/autophagy-related protein 2
MLTLYTHPVSQPARTVEWLMSYKMNPTDFKTIKLNPGSPKQNGTRSKDYLAKTNGVGTVPMLELPTGQCIYESNAILTYLAQKYQWTDLYPDAIEERAKIHQYFNWHHANVRVITYSRCAPLVRLDLTFPEERIAAHYTKARAALVNLNTRLSRTTFICGATATLADFAAAGEILQCLAEFCGMMDEARYPHIVRWTNEMKQFPKFEESHKVLRKFGQKIFQKNWAKAGRSKL